MPCATCLRCGSSRPISATRQRFRRREGMRRDPSSGREAIGPVLDPRARTGHGRQPPGQFQRPVGGPRCRRGVRAGIVLIRLRRSRLVPRAGDDATSAAVALRGREGGGRALRNRVLAFLPRADHLATLLQRLRTRPRPRERVRGRGPTFRIACLTGERPIVLTETGNSPEISPISTTWSRRTCSRHIREGSPPTAGVQRRRGRDADLGRRTAGYGRRALWRHCLSRYTSPRARATSGGPRPMSRSPGTSSASVPRCRSARASAAPSSGSASTPPRRWKSFRTGRLSGQPHNVGSAFEWRIVVRDMQRRARTSSRCIDARRRRPGRNLVVLPCVPARRNVNDTGRGPR